MNNFSRIYLKTSDGDAMNNLIKCIINKRMMFSVDQDENDDVVVNLLERMKQKRKELNDLIASDGDAR